MPEYLDGSQAVLVDRDGNVAGQLSFAIRMLYEHPDLRAQMSTGGFGTLLFSGIGVLLVVAGVGVLLSLKKKNRA